MNKFSFQNSRWKYLELLGIGFLAECLWSWREGSCTTSYVVDSRPVRKSWCLCLRDLRPDPPSTERPAADASTDEAWLPPLKAASSVLAYNQVCCNMSNTRLARTLRLLMQVRAACLRCPI